MIIYTNGDSHTAAGEAVNSYCFACDDPNLWYMGRAPHPDNIKVSYGAVLGRIVKAKFMTDAESASSNDRIIRTTKEFLSRPTNDQVIVVIGWSTWEREEWEHQGKTYQINACMGEDWPEEIKERYREWVTNIDMKKKLQEEHDKIWNFHLELQERGIKHLFFNTFESLAGVEDEKDWGGSYLFPYNNDLTYYNWAISKGFSTVNENSYHFGKHVHYAWAHHLLPYLTEFL